MKTELLLSLLWVGLCVSAAAVNEAVEKGKSDGPAISQAQTSECSDGWTLYKDSCYALINLNYTWENAESLCESLGAHLASAHNLWEYSFMQQLAQRVGLSTAWIGAYYFQNFWKWVDGSTFNYNNWHSQSTASSHACAYLNSQGSRGWTNYYCNNEHPAMCSYKLTSC
ncbi:snaclec coagulation factor IX-binding protein subunit A-like [Pholidichthys leucotaenia]